MYYKEDVDNRWVKAAEIMPWDYIEEVYLRSMSQETGRGAFPARVAYGSIYVKQQEQLTDEETVIAIAENPYIQYFLGLKEFRDEPLFDASMMVHFRKRFPFEELAKINEYICTGKRPEEKQTEDDRSDDDPPAGRGDEKKQDLRFRLLGSHKAGGILQKEASEEQIISFFKKGESMKIRKILCISAFFFLSIAASVSALPSGYGKVQLGMSVDAVKEALKKDHQFGYRGDRDVTLSPKDHETVIETDPTTYASFSFFDRCWFQFSNEKLSVITLSMNMDMIDHYAIFSELCEKYGNPDEISPKKSVWKSDSVTLSLEKPLIIKYVDAKVFKDKQDASKVEKTTSEKAKDAFLKGL